MPHKYTEYFSPDQILKLFAERLLKYINSTAYDGSK